MGKPGSDMATRWCLDLRLLRCNPMHQSCRRMPTTVPMPMRASFIGGAKVHTYDRSVVAVRVFGGIVLPQMHVRQQF